MPSKRTAAFAAFPAAASTCRLARSALLEVISASGPWPTCYPCRTPLKGNLAELSSQDVRLNPCGKNWWAHGACLAATQLMEPELLSPPGVSSQGHGVSYDMNERRRGMCSVVRRGHGSGRRDGLSLATVSSQNTTTRECESLSNKTLCFICG